MPLTGVTKVLMYPEAALPWAPPATARAGTSTVSSPAVRVPSSVVSYSTASSPPLAATVPAGITRSKSRGRYRLKVSTPAAWAASRRGRPRWAPWRSSSSPQAVWGKAWRPSHSSSPSSRNSSPASTRSRSPRSDTAVTSCPVSAR